MNDKERKRLKRKRKLAERSRRGREVEVTLELRPDAWAEEQLAELFATSDRVETLPDGTEAIRFGPGEVHIESEHGPIDDPVTAITSAIERLSGKKIVTLLCKVCSKANMVIDVSADGRWGYHPSHYDTFATNLFAALNGVGSVLVRQFLDEQIAVAHQAEPRVVLIPKKRLYGIALGHCQAICTPPEVLEVCCNTDATTGEPIPPEEGVEYGVLGL